MTISLERLLQALREQAVEDVCDHCARSYVWAVSIGIHAMCPHCGWISNRPLETIKAMQGKVEDN